MMKHRLTFAELRHFLQDMEFKEDLFKGEFFRFRHEPSDTEFIFRHYKPSDRVQNGDIVAVRFFLDQRGLMEADDFDRFLSKTPA